jgi:Putative Ig domain
MEGHMKTLFASRAPFCGALTLCLLAVAALAGCGGGSGSDSTDATVQSDPAAPTISGTPATQVTAGEAYAFTPTASGPSGTTLTFSVQNMPPWASFNTATGMLSGTPSSANVGTFANIVIGVSDGTKAAALPAFTVQVTAALQAPTISGTPPAQVGVGQAYSFTPSAIGPAGATLSFSVQNPPSWAGFNTATGTLSGTPSSSNVGTFSNIVISVGDGQASASLPAFSIQVLAQPPTIGGTPATQVTAGSAYSFTPTASGPSGLTLSFSVQNLPSWATFSIANGTVSGTPSSSNVGTFSNIVISVSDGQASASLPAFSIQVNAVPPPTISGTPATQVTAGSAYSFTPTASGPSGSTLTFSVQNLPSWAAFNSATGALTGTPSSSNVGTFSNITISVSDGQASASLPAFSIQVNAQASGSVPLSWVPPTTNTDGSPLTNLAGYIISYGTSASGLTQQITVASATATSYTVTGLAAGTWYFTVAAYTSVGTQSAPSNTASTTIG